MGSYKAVRDGDYVLFRAFVGAKGRNETNFTNVDATAIVDDEATTEEPRGNRTAGDTMEACEIRPVSIMPRPNFWKR